MSITIEKLAEQAMNLPSESRAHLADLLVESLDADTLTEIDQLWLAEAKHGTLGTTGSYRPPKSPGDYKGAGVGPSPAYSFSASA